MNILFVHQSFPGQFGRLAQALAQQGHTVVALAMHPQAKIPGVRVLQYPLAWAPRNDLPPLLGEMQSKVLRGESAAQAMRELKDKGFTPHVIYAHPGWGEALFAKTVWPAARLVVYAEWFYHLHGQEVNFDPEFPPLSPADELRLELKNLCFLQALDAADAAIAPTQWQKSRFPAWAQERIRVIHDGIDTAAVTLGVPRALRVQGRREPLRYGEPIVTMAARHLEPVRGIHIVLRALAQVLQERPDAHAIILGKDAGMPGTGYGTTHPEGISWREALLEELGDELDTSRVHFLGFVDYKAYLAILRLSACHVYWTVPFILSWSFLEAAAMGVPMVASDTPPVREFRHLLGVELSDFFDADALADRILDVLDRPVVRTPNDLGELDVTATIPAITEVLLPGSAQADAAPPAAPQPAAGSRQKRPTKAGKKTAASATTASSRSQSKGGTKKKS